MSVKLDVKKRNGQPIDIAIDSTGLKVYGEGEWKTRQHGVGSGYHLHQALEADLKLRGIIFS